MGVDRRRSEKVSRRAAGSGEGGRGSRSPILAAVRKHLGLAGSGKQVLSTKGESVAHAAATRRGWELEAGGGWMKGADGGERKQEAEGAVKEGGGVRVSGVGRASVHSSPPQSTA